MPSSVYVIIPRSQVKMPAGDSLTLSAQSIATTVKGVIHSLLFLTPPACLRSIDHKPGYYGCDDCVSFENLRYGLFPYNP